MPRIHIAVSQSFSELDGLAPLWNRLVHTQSHSMFQTYRWNRMAAEIFADRLNPLVVAVESEHGAAIIPAAWNRTTGHLELLGETLFDYRDVVHAGDPEVLQLAWKVLADGGLPLSVTAIATAETQTRWEDFPLRPFANTPQVLCTTTTESHFRSTHRRLGRQLRRIGKQGATLRVYTGKDSAMLHYLYNCKAEQFGADDQSIFRDPRRRQFMVEVAALEGQQCEVFTLQSEDEILIAGLVTFRDAQWRRFYTVYFDPAWAAYSPGVLLVYEATAQSLAEGFNCDYMTGEYPYKMRFANSSRPLYTLDVSADQLAAITTKMTLSKVA